MKSQTMINIIDLPRQWRVVAHRTCKQEEAAGGGGGGRSPLLASKIIVHRYFICALFMLESLISAPYAC